MTTQTKKLIFAALVVILIVAAFYFFSETMTLTEIVGIVVGAGGYIMAAWEWINKEEVKQDFQKEIGIKYSTFKSSEIEKNK